MLKTPILFIIFNRIDTAKQVFAKIREIQPERLFIAADGPRKYHSADNEKCKAVRAWVLEHIDWECDIRTLFREENLGCGKGPAEAITWFFDNVEQGIILEDDCVPDISFFHYCETLLEYYKDDERIMHITGYNPQEISHFKHNASYCFVPVEICWGWASWRRAWRFFCFDIQNTTSVLCAHPYFNRCNARQYWKSVFSAMETHMIGGVWDYQWTYAVLKKKGYCIVPEKNLIQNIGFISDSTHFDDLNANLMKSAHTLSEKIIHPRRIEYNWRISDYTDRTVFGIDCRFHAKIQKACRYCAYVLKKNIKKHIQTMLRRFVDAQFIYSRTSDMSEVKADLRKVRFTPPCNIIQSEIGDYTYISVNSYISYTKIGKFCSIGPNVLCGWGIHPVHFISTSPMFYSVSKQNGFALANRNKVEERKQIVIGNDVFIGANVTILDGVTIGHGAVIGAGATVTKDIPSYAVAAGVPAKVIKYRFSQEQIKALLEIKWWDFEYSELQSIEKYYDDIDAFITQYGKVAVIKEQMGNEHAQQ